MTTAKLTNGCQGFVFCSVLSSLLAVAASDSFEEAITSIISLGGDADTTASMVNVHTKKERLFSIILSHRCCQTGGMAGSCYGLENIPPEWRKGLSNSAEIHERAFALGKLATGTLAFPVEALTLETLVEMEAKPKAAIVATLE